MNLLKPWKKGIFAHLRNISVPFKQQAFPQATWETLQRRCWNVKEKPQSVGYNHTFSRENSRGFQPEKQLPHLSQHLNRGNKAMTEWCEMHILRELNSNLWKNKINKHEYQSNTNQCLRINQYTQNPNKRGIQHISITENKSSLFQLIDLFSMSPLKILTNRMGTSEITYTQWDHDVLISKSAYAPIISKISEVYFINTMNATFCN